jgi:hypothetical protein
MPRMNSVGDLVLTDPAALRALADPVRLALLDRLRHKARRLRPSSLTSRTCSADARGGTATRFAV